MKHLKTYESWDGKVQQFRDRLSSLHIENVDELSIRSYIDIEGYTGEESMTEDEMVEHLLEHINTVKSLDDPMILYRLVSAESKEDIDLNNAGKHYTLNDMYMDDRFMMDIGIDEDLPMWLLTCEVNKDDVDINHTLATNIQYPNENEVSVKPNSKVNVIDIKEFE